MERFALILAAAQAIYFGVTGIWALVSIRTFMMVTGPKTDIWLVKTVGVIVIAIAIPLAVAAAHGRVPLEVALLAIGSSAALSASDVYHVARKVIAKICLADALAEIILIIAWLAC